MAIEVRPFRNPNNVQIFNAIRRNATVDYQKRIPAATQANVQDTINGLLNYRPMMNEFVHELVNRIGLELFKFNSWTNPLAKFKFGMLEYGDTIEEVAIGLLKAKRYDPDREYLERDLFGTEVPDVQTSFHKVNRQDWYKLSINESMLKRAFLDSTGLSKFVNALMSAPTTSDNWDEFLLTASLFSEYHRAGGFFNVNIPDISLASSDGNDARYALRRMRELADTLPYISTHYNAAGMPVAANPDELELFITPEAQAGVDVEALAGAFNIGKAEFASRTTIIPKEHFKIPGVQAVLTTKDFFVIGDTFLETASVPNPVGRHTNLILHHDQVISASRFVPAVLFTSLEPSTVIVLEDYPVTGVTAPAIQDINGDTVTDVTRGQIYQINAEAITEGDNDAVRFVITSGHSLRTYVTQTGTLFIAADEEATEISVDIVAVDTDNPQTFATLTADIVGDLAVLWPNPRVKEDDDLDGEFEVTPVDLVQADDDTVTIPNVEGVQYRKTIKEGITFTDAGDIVTIPQHGASIGDIIVFGTITSTTGITAGTEYFVKTVPSANTLTLSATSGGATLALTTNGTSVSARRDVEPESVHTIGGLTEFTAIAKTPEYELASGVDTSWEFDN